MSQVAPHSDPLPETFNPSSVLLTFLPPEEHSEDVNQLYDRLPEKTRKGFTKDDLAEYLDSRDPKATQEGLIEAINEGGHIHEVILKDAVCSRAGSKLLGIHKLTVSPREADVLIAQILYSEKYALPRPLDPYNYATHGIQQSYETLTTNALFSTRSINQLQGDSVHFMMFASGQTQIRCNIFVWRKSVALCVGCLAGQSVQYRRNDVQCLGDSRLPRKSWQPRLAPRDDSAYFATRDF
jgi:hypothetical protein